MTSFQLAFLPQWQIPLPATVQVAEFTASNSDSRIAKVK